MGVTADGVRGEEMMNIEQIIIKKCKQTMICEFKRDWLPKGYFAAKINKFSKELAKEIRDGRSKG